MAKKLSVRFGVTCLGVLVLASLAWPASLSDVAGTYSVNSKSITAHSTGAPVLLANSCDYDWWYGCSPTSAGMAMGHYDRNGYGSDPATNKYPNLVPGGVAESSTFGAGPYIANDAIASSGHIADFYSGGYGASGDDVATPFHSFDCLADFMGTSQDSQSNSNGATSFWYYGSGSRLYAKDIYDDGPSYYNDSGMFGIYEYVDYSSYGSSNPNTDTNFFNQYIKGEGTNPNLGFTFADYKAETDAGRPVIIHVEGHSMYGYGYDEDGGTDTVHLHDTWTAGDHTMTWGGSYPYGEDMLAHYGVTCMTLTNGVPEPVTGVLLAVGGLALIRRRRKTAA